MCSRMSEIEVAITTSIAYRVKSIGIAQHGLQSRIAQAVRQSGVDYGDECYYSKAYRLDAQLSRVCQLGNICTLWALVYMEQSFVKHDQMLYF